MKTHYSEADLLETYYTAPGQSMPVMMHLAGCTECAARYERLDRKLREAAACHTERPDTFWARQRNAILHTIEHRRPSRLRFAAAAGLLLAIAGGLLTYQGSAPAPAAIPQAEEIVPSDPWESEELQDFGSVVQWESWIDESNLNKKEQRL
ncbi:MAG: hypothetical protein ABIO78_09725 [Thermoanaerobaculia bacterium]